MTLSETKTRVIEEIKKSLNHESKFYQQDLKSAVSAVMPETSKEKLTRQVNNLICLVGGNKAFNKHVAGIVRELDRGGMYDVRKMKYSNALD